MVKARLRKPVRRNDGQAGDAHNEIALTAEFALPPKKPPAPSVKKRFRRGRWAKLLK
jgi:hypothetical protein